ncbi:MAG TPA: DUF1801 domain-containing protein [Candidatus Sulfotelmatobacter sp.]|nr:DUF1801 domain-containing protein [Candidatus Sulfotelmatobacter sp.]
MNETVEAARRMVKAIAPGAEEIAYHMERPRSKSMMWKIVRFADGRGDVVGIGEFAKHSTIYFYRGTELDDGTGLLQGGGKQMRFITLRSPADAERADVKRMVRKAFKLGGAAPRAAKGGPKSLTGRP